MIFLHLSLPAWSPCDVPSNKGWAGGREWQTINTIHSVFFSSATFPHQRGTSLQTPQSLWTQMLLPVKSHPVSLSHHVGQHVVKLLLLRRTFQRLLSPGSTQQCILFQLQIWLLFSWQWSLCCWREEGNFWSHNSVHFSNLIPPLLILLLMFWGRAFKYSPIMTLDHNKRTKRMDARQFRLMLFKCSSEAFRGGRCQFSYVLPSNFKLA